MYEKIKAKENQLNFLKKEVSILTIEEKLQNPKLQDKIKLLHNKFCLEICNDHPNALWDRKIHIVDLPYENEKYAEFLTFRGGLDPVTRGLWLTDIAHHHLAIAILFLIAGHIYRTKDILIIVKQLEYYYKILSVRHSQILDGIKTSHVILL